MERFQSARIQPKGLTFFGPYNAELGRTVCIYPQDTLLAADGCAQPRSGTVKPAAGIGKTARAILHFAPRHLFLDALKWAGKHLNPVNEYAMNLGCRAYVIDRPHG